MPALTVTDLEASPAFCLAAGFRIRFRRASPEFAHIEPGQAHVMLEQHHPGSWKTAELRPPYGRGLNLQIEVESVDRIRSRFAAGGIPLFEAPAEAWYETAPGTQEGQIELLAQDPDGYLMRFAQVLGTRRK